MSPYLFLFHIINDEFDEFCLQPELRVTSRMLGRQSRREPPQKKTERFFGASGGKRSRNGEKTPQTGKGRRAPAATWLRGHKQNAWQDEVGENRHKKRPKGLLEQVAGIEPATTAWEADVLPLNYTCIIFMLAQHFCFVKNFRL